MENLLLFQQEQKKKKLLYSLIKQDNFLKSYSSSHPSSFYCQIQQYKPKKIIKKTAAYDPTKNSFEYDFSLDINLDTIFTDGIDLQISERFKQIFNDEFSGTILGVFGKANKGKTYILSKLFNLCDNYKKRLTEHTPDIACKLHGDNQILLCDSRGTGIALNKDHTDDQSVNLNKIREYFPKLFISRLCGIIIYIMGELDTNEMKHYYERMKGIQDKTIIIIHNLKHITTLNEFNNYINNSLRKKFDLNARALFTDDNKKYYCYVEKQNDKFVHFVCGNWDSNELKETNQNVSKFIYNSIKINVSRKNNNLRDFTQSLIQIYLKYFFKKEKNNNENEDENIPIQASTNNNRHEPVDIQINLEQGKIYIDQQNIYKFSPNKMLDTLISSGKTYKCSNYRIYTTCTNDEEKLFVEVDLLGNVQDIKLTHIEQNGIYKLKVKGKYMHGKEDNKYILNEGNYDMFITEIDIPIDKDKEIDNFKDLKRKYEYLNGYIRIEYQIIPKMISTTFVDINEALNS